jgi:AraC family transcriptional regulator
VTAYPRLSFQLTVKGGSEMKYRLAEKEAFRIAGVRRRVPIQFSGANPAIAAMWGSLTEEIMGQLKALPNVEPAGLIQASVNFSGGRMEEKRRTGSLYRGCHNRRLPFESDLP